MQRIRQLKKEGYSKREIFKRVCGEGLVPKKVARYLATYPDADDAARYNAANNILIVIFAVSVFLSPLWAQAILEPPPIGAWLLVLALMVITVYFLYRKMVTGYMLVCAIMLLPISIALASDVPPPLAVAQAAFFAAISAFSFILKIKLYPFHGLFFLKKDENGLTQFTKTMADDGQPEEPASRS
ncbi:MAG TPA: hypothetical protein VK991_08730 [Halomonas sp.]|nr:hypothetical protein [Halomonas sp.]